MYKTFEVANIMLVAKCVRKLPLTVFVDSLSRTNPVFFIGINLLI